MPNIPPIQIEPTTTARRKKRRGNDRLIVGAVVGCMALVVVVIAVVLSGDEKDELVEGSGESSVRHEEVKPTVPRPALEERPVVADKNVRETPIDDDGRTLWMSPTSGAEVPLEYLPPGVQLVVHLCPRANSLHSEGEKIIDALGPLGQSAIRSIEQTVGTKWNEIDELTIAFRSGVKSTDMTIVLRFNQSEADQSRRVVAGQGRWSVVDGKQTVLVIASPETLKEIIELEGFAPPMRRELERLIANTDRTRSFTLVCAPNYLFGEGKAVFTGLGQKLKQPLFEMLPDSLHALSLSMHWEEAFFIELQGIAIAELAPRELARSFSNQLKGLPTGLEDHILGQTWHPYSRRLIARLPAMLRVLASNMRNASTKEVAILRAYLPLPAGHNLLMASEVLLAQGAGSSQSNTIPATVGAKTIAEKLQKKTSLRFVRDTLESALAQLAEDIDVPIVISGQDLKLEGITKNQSFGIDLENQPAQEILVAILRLANPEKTAKSPDDPLQKLVYIFTNQPPPGISSTAREMIMVTTRSQAKERGDQLPQVFSLKESVEK